MIRKTAYDILNRIEKDKAYSHLAIDAELELSKLDARDRGLVTNIVYGTLSWQRALDTIIAKFSKRKMQDIHEDVLQILRIGIYQLIFLERIPNHAAIHQTVELAKSEQPKSAGFVNAILRTISRTQNITWWNDNDRQKKPARYLGQRYSIPNWLAGRLIQMLKIDEAERVAEGFSKQAENYIRLRKSNVEFGETIADYPDARKILGIDSEVRSLLEKNQLVVQDLGAQRIVLACEDVQGKRVLDACAGMGGKSLYLFDRGANVTAVEPHKKRLEKLNERERRIQTFAGMLENFKTEIPFDVVLVDAPCSALGVIRRHPETKWTRRESDISQLEKIQLEILDSAAQQVAEKGKLVYAVCTFTREETTKQVERFLERNPEFELETQEQLWPHRDHCDAFFIARFVKK